MSSSASHFQPFDLRGRVFRAVALAPRAPVAEWLGRLDAALARSPALFSGKPVILDVTGLGADEEALRDLVAELSWRVTILGIEGSAPEIVHAAAGLPQRLTGGRPHGETVAIQAETPATEDNPQLTSLTIEGSVRSGQCIIHREGDVTVMGSVASGAEILAGGSIHVYGALRGRAIAGAAKNPRARIYCRKFEPELLGIDRLVRTAEDMGTHLRGQAVQIWSEAGAIKIAALG